MISDAFKGRFKIQLSRALRTHSRKYLLSLLTFCVDFGEDMSF